MVLNIVIVYLYLFLSISFAIYFIYALAIFPITNKISENITNTFENFSSNYAILILILFIFLVFNNLLLHINHTLFIFIKYIVILSCGVFLSSLIAYKLVNNFQMLAKSNKTFYIIIFLLMLLAYILIVI